MLESQKFSVVEIGSEYRNQLIEMINLFFKQINSYALDGKFQVKPRAGAKMADVFLKLQGSGKVLVLGAISPDKELQSILLARVEEKPYLEEEKVMYIELAVTKPGKRNRGFMKELLDYSYNWAKRKKIFIVELRALTENKPAIDFWKKNGFNDFYIRFRRSI